MIEKNNDLPGFIETEAVRVRTLVSEYRSEEHTSELQSQSNLVCRLLLEKKNCPSTRPELDPYRKWPVGHLHLCRHPRARSLQLCRGCAAGSACQHPVSSWVLPDRERLPG